MGRLIDVDEIPFFQTEDGAVVAYKADIEQIPSAQPEKQWIPCSERLPEDDTEVFVYLFDQPSPYIAWVEDTRWYTEEFEVEREDEPIAWMPLPEPFPEPWRGKDNAN